MKVVSQADAVNLSDLLKSGDWMVLYYAEWCGHCNAMKPEWEKFVNKMKDPSINSTNIKIADVKSDVISEMKGKPEIPGFPTIKMYSNGKEVADFKEDRVAEKMVEFAKSNVKSSVSNKANNAKANNAKANNAKAKEPEIVAVDATAVVPIANVVEPTKEELPMVAINTEMPPNIDLLSHKSKKHNTGIKKTKSKSTRKVSAIKQSVKPIKMDNILEMPKEETPDPSPVPVPGTIQQAFINLPCNEIHKAKHCKSNPKCMFDYPGNKCVDKSLPVLALAKLPSTKAKSLVSRKSKAKNSKKAKANNNKPNNKVNDVKKSTKEVFSKLVKSFGRISNEAKKDAQILQNATAKL